MGIVQDEWDRVNREIDDQQKMGRLFALIDIATILDETLPERGESDPWRHVEAVKKIFGYLMREKARLGDE